MGKGLLTILLGLALLVIGIFLTNVAGYQASLLVLLSSFVLILVGAVRFIEDILS